MFVGKWEIIVCRQFRLIHLKRDEAFDPSCPERAHSDTTQDFVCLNILEHMHTIRAMREARTDCVGINDADLAPDRAVNSHQLLKILTCWSQEAHALRLCSILLDHSLTLLRQRINH